MDNCVSIEDSHLRLFVYTSGPTKCHVLTWQTLCCLGWVLVRCGVQNLRLPPMCCARMCLCVHLCACVSKKDVVHWQWRAPGCWILEMTLNLSILHSHGCRDGEHVCMFVHVCLRWRTMRLCTLSVHIIALPKFCNTDSQGRNISKVSIVNNVVEIVCPLNLCKS